MKQILVSQTVKVPDGVIVKVKARRVTVEGPRGKLTRDFKHLALDMEVRSRNVVSTAPTDVCTSNRLDGR